MRELRDAGELSGLPGEGSPLPADPDDDAGEAWAARHVVRTSGAQPVWAELRRDITERRVRIVTRLRGHLAWVARRQELRATGAEARELERNRREIVARQHELSETLISIYAPQPAFALA